LEIFEERFRFGINGIGQRLERVLFGIVEESAFLEEKRNILLAPSLISVSTLLHFGSLRLTVSLTILQISADPAFITGRTLISFASETFFAVVEVKRDFRLTFQ
jgi:hypothetical protein